MMSPTLVADSQGDFEIAIGTGGGSRIPAAIAQVLHYLIDFDLDTTTAVNAARMHNEHNELNLEPQLVGNDLVEEHLKVVNWKTSSMFFGGVHTIQKKDGTFHAAADDRREGFAIKL